MSPKLLIRFGYPKMRSSFDDARMPRLQLYYTRWLNISNLGLVEIGLETVRWCFKIETRKKGTRNWMPFKLIKLGSLSK